MDLATALEYAIAAAKAGERQFGKGYFLDGTPWSIDEVSRRIARRDGSDQTIAVVNNVVKGADPGSYMIQWYKGAGNKDGFDSVNMVKVNGQWLDYTTMEGVQIAGAAGAKVTTVGAGTPTVITKAAPVISAPFPVPVPT